MPRRHDAAVEVAKQMAQPKRPGDDLPVHGAIIGRVGESLQVYCARCNTWLDVQATPESALDIHTAADHGGEM